MKAYLALGSNIEPARNLPAAVARLRSVCRVVRASPVYRSPPAAGARGPDFWNAVLLVETACAKIRPLLRAVEAALGRRRPAPRHAPRPIDLDLAWVEGEPPHTDVASFAHVAVPLADLVPDLVHPGAGMEMRALAARLREGVRLERLAVDLGAVNDAACGGAAAGA